MYALPALTTIAAEAVRDQFTTDASPAPEPAYRLERTRAALAAALDRAARAIAPPRLAAWRG
jgi:hypothetical protein